MLEWPTVTRTRRPKTPRTAASRRFFAVLRGFVLALLSAGTLAPSLHFAVVEHDLCEEHGELHHGEASALGEESSAHPAGTALNAAPSVEGEHDHCGVLATSSSRASSASASAFEHELSFAVVLAHPPDADVAHASLELLFYAPKLAPPA